MATSLLNLEEDLTCSICLCPFDGPVSLTCGHSFCQRCLEAAWRGVEPVSCPHCRTLYTVRPELKRNTVLSAVVETLRTASDAIPHEERVREVPMPKLEPEPKPVLCDTCMEAKAESTCMTCAASFCIEHVRPHRENPVFRAHRLVEPPLADLHSRLCTEHAKLLEFYCVQHERAMCSGCLQEQHRGCDFCTVEEQRVKKQSEMKDKLGTLDGKIEKNQLVISQMREQQAKLKDVAAVRKRALEQEYQQVRDLLQRDESEAMKALEKDLEGGQSKLGSLMKKFNQNIEKMNGTKDEIGRLLTQSDSMDFLQASVDLPSVVSFEPYTPRINLDSKAVIAHHACIVGLKEQVSRILSQPVETRQSNLKQGASLPNPREAFFAHSEDARPNSPPHAKGAPGAGKKNPQPRERKDNKGEKKDNKGEKKDNKGEKKDSKGEKKDNKGDKKDNKDHKERREHKGERSHMFPNAVTGFSFSSMENISGNFSKGVLDLGFNKFSTPGMGISFFSMENSPVHPPKAVPDLAPVDISSAAKRSDLLKYATILMFDQRTAHRRVALSENNTKASVSDEPSAYPEVPPRFTVCSQVLCSKGFSQGRHYWEVKMSSNNFCGIGLAYGSIDRKGPSSRLGRNAQSWCVEWFNVKLSAWHNSSETVLSNPNPSRVGVLLDCDEGCATFYNVSDRAYPFHMFVFPFSEPVYPAFWIFSSGSSITLCKLNN